MMQSKPIHEVINLKDVLTGARSCAISGHVRPDGDCVGSAAAMALYLKEYWPHIKTDVFLEEIPDTLKFLTRGISVHHSLSDRIYDVFFCLDCSDASRLGEFGSLMFVSRKTVCIDHHATAQPQTQISYVDPEASSTCELAALLLGEKEITEPIALALYTGIIHDTGVFRYSNTSPRTLRVSASLLEKGIDHSTLCEETFFSRSFLRQKLLGYALTESSLMLDGQVIVSAISRQKMEEMGADPNDLDGIASHLKSTDGVHVSVFMDEIEEDVYKVSLRSDQLADISIIAKSLGGGGHKRASGCNVTGPLEKATAEILEKIKEQLSR